MWHALGQPVEELVGSGAGQVALEVRASTAWVAAEVSLLVWLVAPRLVASVEGAAALAVALEVAMEVALVAAEG